MLARVQAVKIGNAVDAKQHGLAVENKLPAADTLRGLDDERIAIGPIVAIASEQPAADPAALCHQPEAVQFDFMQPVRPRGRAGCGHWQAGVG